MKTQAISSILLTLSLFGVIPLYAGDLNVDGDLSVTGVVTTDGNEVYHAGNLPPATGDDLGNHIVTTNLVLGIHRLEFFTGNTAIHEEAGVLKVDGESIQLIASNEVVILADQARVQESSESEVKLKVHNLNSSGVNSAVDLILQAGDNQLEMLVYGDSAAGNLSGFPRSGSAYFRSTGGLPINRFVLGTGSAAPLHFIVGDVSRQTISADGNVGIGTNTPSAKLEVVGNIIAHSPQAANHVATRQYVDQEIAAIPPPPVVIEVDPVHALWLTNNPNASGLGNHSAVEDLKMAGNKVVNIADGTANTDAVNLGQMDAAISNALNNVQPQGGIVMGDYN